jgi:hypothetical protein
MKHIEARKRRGEFWIADDQKKKYVKPVCSRKPTSDLPSRVLQARLVCPRRDIASVFRVTSDTRGFILAPSRSSGGTPRKLNLRIMS